MDVDEKAKVTEQQRRFVHVPSQAHGIAVGDTKSPSGRYKSSPFGRTCFEDGDVIERVGSKYNIIQRVDN